jgi:hypothetical protein
MHEVFRTGAKDSVRLSQLLLPSPPPPSLALDQVEERITHRTRARAATPEPAARHRRLQAALPGAALIAINPMSRQARFMSACISPASGERR